MLETAEQISIRQGKIAASETRAGILKVFRKLETLLLDYPHKYYKVDLRLNGSISDTPLVAEIWANDSVGHYNWITIREYESPSAWKKKLKVARDYAKGKISLIPNNCQ